MNPMNSLATTLAYYKRDLAELQAKHANLKLEHSKMVKDAVETEISFDLCKDSIQKMCDGCTKQQTQDCENCSLNSVAIKFNLWG